MKKPCFCGMGDKKVNPGAKSLIFGALSLEMSNYSYIPQLTSNLFTLPFLYVTLPEIYPTFFIIIRLNDNLWLLTRANSQSKSSSQQSQMQKDQLCKLEQVISAVVLK